MAVARFFALCALSSFVCAAAVPSHGIMKGTSMEIGLGHFEEAIIQDNEDCTRCMQVLTQAEVQLLTHEPEIEAQFKLRCETKLPAAQCAGYAKLIGPALLKALEGDLAPQTLCQKANQCGPFAGLRPTLKIARLPAVGADARPLVNDGAECDICEAADEEIASLLADNSTRTAALKELEALCSELGSEAADCQQLLAQYGPPMIDALIAVMNNPQAACASLGYCSDRSAADWAAPAGEDEAAGGQA